MTSGKSPCLDALVHEFGSAILSPCGGLDRKKLADIVFGGEDAPSKRMTLNKIAHHFVRIETETSIKRLENEGYSFVAIDAPLLFESGFDKMCDVTVAVIADKNARIERIMKRDGIDRMRASLRIDSQLSDAELTSRCNYKIVNNGTLAELYNEVSCVIRKIQI